MRQHESEKYYLDPNRNDEKEKFPSVLSAPSIDLSIIVPSYNEEKRCN
jgi:dolichyl-phosphate beta-glucosyltransferase